MRIVCLSIVLLAILSATTALAGAPDPQAKALADKLFTEAQADLSQGRHEQACNKFEQVIRLDDTLGGRLQLGICYEKINKLASASALYAEVERIGTPSAVQKDRDAAAIATKLHKELEPRIPKLEIVVSAAIKSIAGVEIKQNGTNIPESLWNNPIPVDIGMHHIEVSAPGREPWKTDIEVKENDQPVPKPLKLEVQPPGGPLPQQRASTPSSPARTAGFVGIAVGVAGVGIGAVFGALAITKNQQSTEGGHCLPNNVCDEVGKPLRNDALMLANGSTAAFIAGGVLLGTGIILVATSTKGKTSTGKTSEASFGVGPSGIILRGRF